VYKYVPKPIEISREARNTEEFYLSCYGFRKSAGRNQVEGDGFGYRAAAEVWAVIGCAALKPARGFILPVSNRRIVKKNIVFDHSLFKNKYLFIYLYIKDFFGQG